MIGVDHVKFLFNGRKLIPGAVAVGATTLVIENALSPLPPAADPFPNGTIAFVTDGVGVLELYGEYVRVIKSEVVGNKSVLTLESGVRNSYIDGRTAVVPGRFANALNKRGWVEDLTIRGPTFGGIPSPTLSDNQLLANFCYNLTLDRVRNILADPALVNHGNLILATGRLNVSGCDFSEGEGLGLNACSDVVVEESRVLVAAEELCRDSTFRDRDIVHRFNNSIGASRLLTDNCRFHQVSILGFADGTTLVRCHFRIDPAIRQSVHHGGDRLVLREVRVLAGFLALHLFAGTGHHVENCRIK